MDRSIKELFELQQANLAKLKATTASERIKTLQALKRALTRYRSEIIKAAAADFNKPESEVMLAELMPVYSEIKHTCSHLKSWMKPQKVSTPLTLMGTSSKVVYEPKGVSLIISPWNYPFYLSLGPLVSAIAAGCSAIIKPSEMTPNMSAVIRRIVEDVFEPEMVAVVEGAVEETTELLALPFDHIFFTGSPSVGKIVMSAAAKNLTSVTLELGGKSPVIVDKKANIKTAVARILWGKFTNNGQTCIAPDYLLVDDAIYDEFLDEMKVQLEATYGKVEEQQSSKDLARIVNDRHFKRVNEMLEDAKATGADIYGGVADEADCYISPTVIENPDPNSKVMTDEIFGPLLPVVRYNTLDEAFKLIDSKEKPLALYAFTRDKSVEKEIIKRTTAGGSCINTCLLHFIQDNLPVGGVNNSGIGKAHGHFGFIEFTNPRGVLKDNFSITGMLAPPYTPKVKKLMDLTVGFVAR